MSHKCLSFEITLTPGQFLLYPSQLLPCHDNFLDQETLPPSLPRSGTFGFVLPPEDGKSLRMARIGIQTGQRLVSGGVRQSLLHPGADGARRATAGAAQVLREAI